MTNQYKQNIHDSFANLKTISLLKQISQVSVPPTSWRILESIDNTYSLEYSYDIDAPVFSIISTTRGKIKNYKSIKAAIADVKSITIDATIHFEFAQIESS